MRSFEFAYPGLLFLLLLLIPAIAYYIFKQKNRATVQVSNTEAIEQLPVPLKQMLIHIVYGMYMLAIALLIIVLARPQSTNTWENVSTQGIDIVLAIDISSSMLARDLRPNRLEASKDMAMEFISGRRNDRMGLVVFSGESFTQCPLTTDHAILINLFRDVKSGIIEDGTALGVGLANAVSRLKDSETVSKVVILLTDGVNNQGAIDPITAAELAKTFGIRVYTIGVGTQGTAPYPVQDRFGRTQIMDMPVEIDEATLQQISDITDGVYFRATDNDRLRQVYNEIDQLEKSKINVKEFSRPVEEYLPFAIAALALLLLAFIVQNTILRTIP